MYVHALGTGLYTRITIHVYDYDMCCYDYTHTLHIYQKHATCILMHIDIGL